MRWVTAISNCFTVSASCFGKPIDSNSDTDPSVEIVPVADAYSSVTDDVSSLGELDDFGESNSSESLNILIEISGKYVSYSIQLESNLWNEILY